MATRTRRLDRHPRCPYCNQRLEFRGVDETDMSRWECDPCLYAVLLSRTAIKLVTATTQLPMTPGEAL